MTAREAWHVARRSLGVYFVVEGCLLASGAIAMAGIVLPAGSTRTVYVTGVSGLARFVVDLFVLTGAWMFRGSQLASAAVEVIAGALLTVRAADVAAKLT